MLLLRLLPNYSRTTPELGVALEISESRTTPKTTPELGVAFSKSQKLENPKLPLRFRSLESSVFFNFSPYLQKKIPALRAAKNSHIFSRLRRDGFKNNGFRAFLCIFRRKRIFLLFALGFAFLQLKTLYFLRGFRKCMY